MTTDTKNENSSVQVPQEAIDEIRAYAESLGFTSERVDEIVQKYVGVLEEALGELETPDPRAYGVTIIRNSFVRESSLPETTRKQERTQEEDKTRSKENTRQPAADNPPTVGIKKRKAMELSM